MSHYIPVHLTFHDHGKISDMSENEIAFSLAKLLALKFVKSGLNKND